MLSDICHALTPGPPDFSLMYGFSFISFLISCDWFHLIPIVSALILTCSYPGEVDVFCVFLFQV